mmetsp:Transcript_31673/g.46737  ORF Transcript_31673/g.46737 Transcript_31673/m.46737 type:complete len:209 (+) Transcript_31673:226-852(+)
MQQPTKELWFLGRQRKLLSYRMMAKILIQLRRSCLTRKTSPRAKWFHTRRKRRRRRAIPNGNLLPKATKVPRLLFQKRKVVLLLFRRRKVVLLLFRRRKAAPPVLLSQKRKAVHLILLFPKREKVPLVNHQRRIRTKRKKPSQKNRLQTVKRLRTLKKLVKRRSGIPAEVTSQDPIAVFPRHQNPWGTIIHQMATPGWITMREQLPPI